MFANTVEKCSMIALYLVGTAQRYPGDIVFGQESRALMTSKFVGAAV
jgi:hypothetical protein